jgi:hypothetical protein
MSFKNINYLSILLSDSKEEDKKKTRSKVRVFYKSLLKACDKYDEIRKSFDEIYNPINEQYQELSKIPGLIPESSQLIIQNAFDNIDEATGIADDFCSTLRGEFEPILKRLKISIEEIIDEIAVEKTQQANPPNTDPGVSNTVTQTVTSIATSGGMTTGKIVALIAIAAIVIGGSSIAAFQSGIDTDEKPLDYVDINEKTQPVSTSSGSSNSLVGGLDSVTEQMDTPTPEFTDEVNIVKDDNVSPFSVSTHNCRIVDERGNQLNSVTTNQKVQIGCNLSTEHNKEHEFAVLWSIIDSDKSKQPNDNVSTAINRHTCNLRRVNSNSISLNFNFHTMIETIHLRSRSSITK